MISFLAVITATTCWTVGYPAWRAFVHIRELHRDRQRTAAAVSRLAALVVTNGRWADGCTELLAEARDSTHPVSFWSWP